MSRISGMDIPYMKQLNGRAVLEAIRANGRMGRKQIAEVTNLSVPTVWRLVKDLVDDGIVTEVSPTGPDGTRGRRTSLLDIAPQAGWVVAIDIGGSHIKAAAADLAGRIHESTEVSVEGGAGEEFVTLKISDVLTRLIRKCKRTKGQPMAIGISCPGAVDTERGIIMLSRNLMIENYPVGRVASGVCDVPVVVVNSGAASAFLELKRGHGRQNPSFGYISVGAGIGACYILNGEIYNAGSRKEFGLTLVAQESYPERFGGRGYLEALASGRGIATAARKALEAGERSLLSGMAEGNLESITAKMVATAAQRGDGLAKSIMARAADYLAIGIVNLANILGLRLFVLSGGICRAGDVFWEPLRRSVDKYEFWPGEIVLQPSMVAEDTAILGVGLLAVERAFETLV